MDLTPINPTLDNLQRLHNPDFDSINDIVNKCIKSCMKARDEKILNLLKEEGFEFKSHKELEVFAKERCSVQVKGKLHIFCVDNKPMCEWFDTIDYSHTADKFTVTFGTQPH